MENSRRKQESSARCVFCGGKGLSKEHIVSEWLKDILPRTPANSQVSTHAIFNHETEDALISTLSRNRPGSLHTRKVRKVCERCNNGWMSGIVSRAKKSVESMVKNQPTSLNQTAQRDVAAWIALMTIMAEFMDDRLPGVPAEDRKSVWISEEPPQDWTICVGRYGGSTWAEGGVRYRHHASLFAELLPGPRTISNTVEKKFQVTTIAIGVLFIHCFSSNITGIVPAFRDRWIPCTMTTIWPLAQENVSYTSLPLLGDDDAVEISDAFAAHFFNHFSKPR